MPSCEHYINILQTGDAVEGQLQGQYAAGKLVVVNHYYHGVRRYDDNDQPLF